MPRVRVLVVDDSQLARDVIKSLLATDSGIEVIAEAGDGREALEKVVALKPDLVTMDLDMPGMNGLQAIEEIMAYAPVPILVVSAQDDARTACEAISRGALDVLGKSGLSGEAAASVVECVKLLARVPVITHVGGKRERAAVAPQPSGGGEVQSPDRVVVVASSTGGPIALTTLLSGLPAPFVSPIVIAQHLSDGFSAAMAQWLADRTRHRVRLVQHNDTLLPGMVYLSPSEKHTEVVTGHKTILRDRVPGDIYRPSCNLLLSSAARAYGAGCIGVVLTGIGDDGASGIEEVSRRGGVTIAQDEATSVVFGMPRAAIESGSIDYVLPLDQIGATVRRVMVSTPERPGTPPVSPGARAPSRRKAT